MTIGGGFLLEPVIGPVFSREMFSDDQRDIDGMVREFARDQILPRRDELAEHNRELTLELLRAVAELGLTGIDVPEEYGGLGLDKTTSALVAEALAFGGSASWLVTFSAHVGIGTLPIVFFGSREQKERYLPRLARVELLGAYSLTEPDAGSDALGIQATARESEDGKSYLLSGKKLWVTNGGWADLFIVFAKLDDGKMSAFIVEGDSPGLSRGSEERKMGIKGSSTVSLFLEDVRVPKENLLGKPGDGHHIALNILNVGRFKLGASDLGGCKRAVTETVRYALERRQFGQPVGYFEAVRKKLADMVVRTYVLDSAIYRTVGLMDERSSALDPAADDYGEQAMAALEEYAIEASIAKILGSETMSRVADHGIQIFGGNGFSEEYPLAEAYRDCRIDRIFEGTNEINRLVIYGYFLKKALMEELPLRQAEKACDATVPASDAPLAWETGALEAARRLSVKALHEAISRSGQDLRHDQIVGEDLADLVIGYFAASAALNRALQQGEAFLADRPHRGLVRLAVAGYLEEVWRIYYRLRPVLFHNGRLTGVADLAEQLHLPFDPVKEVHVLTDDLFHHGSYRFE